MTALTAAQAALDEKIRHADERACYWLAMANDAIEIDNQELSDRFARQYERKAQYWLDCLNRLEGNYE